MIRWCVTVAALASFCASPGVSRAQGDAAATHRALLERQLLVSPTDVGLYLELSRAYAAAGRWEEAERTLRRGLERAASPDPVRAALVDLLARGERWGDALAAAESLPPDSTTRTATAKLRVNAGLDAYRHGDRDAARRHWERALRDDPALVEAAVDLGALLIEIGEREAARQVATAALRHHPDESRLLALRAGTLAGEEGARAALVALRGLRSVNPGDEKVALELARLLAAVGDHAEAAELYDTLVHAPRASEAAYAAAIDFRLDGSQVDAAATVASTAVDRFPRSGPLWALLGEAEAGRERWRQAAAAYRRATELLPDPAEAQLALAEAYAAGGDTAAALHVFATLDGGTAARETMLRAAARAPALGHDELADSLYAALLARNPKDVTALTAAAQLAEFHGDTAGALARYAAAATSDSSGAAPQLALLRLARPTGDSATRILRRAVWRGIEELQALELRTAGAVSGGVTRRALAKAEPLFDRRRRALELLRAALDSVVFHTAWGERELHDLRDAYPQSLLLERYDADLAARRGRDSLALARYEALLRQAPTDPALHRARADVFTHAGRLLEAAGAYERALELAPEDASTFRALVRLREDTGTLARLLAQIRRLRVALPESAALAEHEVEVLHRLGQPAAAESVARSRKERTP